MFWKDLLTSARDLDKWQPFSLIGSQDSGNLRTAACKWNLDNSAERVQVLWPVLHWDYCKDPNVKPLGVVFGQGNTLKVTCCLDDKGPCNSVSCSELLFCGTFISSWPWLCMTTPAQEWFIVTYCLMYKTFDYLKYVQKSGLCDSSSDFLLWYSASVFSLSSFINAEIPEKVSVMDRFSNRIAH